MDNEQLLLILMYEWLRPDGPYHFFFQAVSYLRGLLGRSPHQLGPSLLGPLCLCQCLDLPNHNPLSPFPPLYRLFPASPTFEAQYSLNKQNPTQIQCHEQTSLAETKNSSPLNACFEFFILLVFLVLQNIAPDAQLRFQNNIVCLGYSNSCATDHSCNYNRSQKLSCSVIGKIV